MLSHIPLSASLGHTLPILFLLVGLELVLGVDNVLVIAILSGRLPPEQRNKARVIGLSLALGVRVLMLFGVTWLLGLEKALGEQYGWIGKTPLLSSLGWLSWKDVILVLGGLFLLYKAVTEIHHTVELREEGHAEARSAAYWPVVGQIVILDIVFSIDSVITAVGLTKDVYVIIAAVVLSFLVILAFARPIGDFIVRNPALKILALAFLVTIGVTIFLEGIHHHVDKAYIYLPMGFALAVELLQMRYDRNRRRSGDGPGHGPK